MVKRYLWRYPKERRSTVIGPNCAGIISPGKAMLGIMPGHIYKRGTVGLVTRSGTLGYEAASQMKALGIGISTSVGIGGDPINGSSFVDMLQLFEEDPETEAVMMIGEIGGPQEAEAALFAKEHMKKPVIGYVAGLTAPKGRRMGHAGAIIRAFGESAAEKVEIMKGAGLTVVPSPADLGSTAARGAGRPVEAGGGPHVSARPIVVVTRRLPEPVHQALRAGVRRAAQPGGPPAHGGRSAGGAPAAPTRCSRRSPTRSRPTCSPSSRAGPGWWRTSGWASTTSTSRRPRRAASPSPTRPTCSPTPPRISPITLLLMVARRTGEGERHLRGGQWTGWRPTHMLGTQVARQDARSGRHGADRARGGAARAPRLRHAGHLPRSVPAAGRSRGARSAPSRAPPSKRCCARRTSCRSTVPPRPRPGT